MMKRIVKYLNMAMDIFLYASFTIIVLVAGYLAGRIFIAD